MGEETNSSISDKARSSVIWNAGFSLFRDLVQFCQTLILARIIAPEAYGQFGLVVSLIGFISILSARSFISHVLQVKDDDDALFQEHFTFGAFLQGGLFAATNLIAIGLRYLPTYAEVAIPIHVMSVTFLLDMPCEIRLKMLERSLDWKRRRLLHAVGLVAGMFVAIGMALLGAGVYALLVPGLLVAFPFIYDLFVRAKWRPTWDWNWADYRPALHFGLARLAGGLALTGRQLLESAVLVTILGFGPLGILNRAIGLCQMACGKLGSQLMYAIYPILPRLNAATGQAAKAGNLVLQINSWVTIPTAVCVSYLAYPIIATVYGSAWLDAVQLMKWAASWISVSSLVYVAYTLLLARQQSRLCLITDFVSLIGTGLCLWLLLPRGIFMYLQGVTAIAGVTFGALCWVLIREKSLSFIGLRTALVPPCICSVIAVYGATLTVHSVRLDMTRFLPAAVWGTLFFGFYALTLRLGFGRPLSELVSYFPGQASIRRVLFLSA